MQGSGDGEEEESVSESKLPSSIHSRPSKQMRRSRGKESLVKSQRDQRHASIIIRLNFEREKSGKLSF
jgi:hypothetical protein